MKRIYHILLLMTALLLSGCVKNEFDITVTLPAKVSRMYPAVYYASDKHKGWIVEGAITVTSGKGELHGITRNPTVVWVGADGGGGTPLVIWAERGDKIEITGEDGDPLTWTVGGNKINEEWSVWRQDNLAALRSRESKKVNAAVAKYVKGHKDSDLSTLLLLTTYVRADNPTEFATLWNSVDTDAKSNEILAAVGRADLQTAAPIDPPLKVGPYKLHCEGDTVLDVSPGKYDASVVYFWAGDENSRRSDLDSLRKLFGESHDGRLLDVTDIALTQDSMSWLNRVRMDSIGTAKWRRGWAPGGRLNSRIASFDVPASPWFVVLDSKGVQVYRGKKVDEALKAARTTLRKAPARKKTELKDSVSKSS